MKSPNSAFLPPCVCSSWGRTNRHGCRGPARSPVMTSLGLAALGQGPPALHTGPELPSEQGGGPRMLRAQLWVPDLVHGSRESSVLV